MTIVVVDASRLERNLNLALQVMEITDRVVVCLNLIDEAKRHGLAVDERRLARDLGVPVVPTSARYNQGMEALLNAIHDVATGEVRPKPRKVKAQSQILSASVEKLESQILQLYPDLPNSRWVALRLLDGDEDIIRSLKNGDLGNLIQIEALVAEQAEQMVKEAL